MPKRQRGSVLHFSLRRGAIKQDEVGGDDPSTIVAGTNPAICCMQLVS
jgi:hypothetical protein